MKRIAIIPNHKRDIGYKYTNMLCKYLIEKDVQIYMYAYNMANIDSSIKDKIIFSDIEDIFSKAQCAITLGGDGTILKIAHSAAERYLPILGINLGHLGYMTELEKNNEFKLEQFLDGQYKIESRMMLNIKIERDNEIISEYTALNDAVISNGEVAKMIKLEMYCNEQIINETASDGIIVSTPTGSTAYNLSAGGPIIQPSVECISVIPICPHSILSRAIIFSSSDEISVKVIDVKGGKAYLTVDGDCNTPLYEGDIIKCKKDCLSTKLIRLNDHNFFDVLKEKMSERRI